MTDTLTMYDSTTATDIPEDAEAVAGYVNGAYAWSSSDWARFTAAKVVRHIVVSAVNEGDTADVENGDLTIAQVPAWIAKRTTSGVEEADLWLYVDEANFEELRTAVGHFAGVYWVADWTGEPHELEGAGAVQYANPDTSGGHYDLSTIYATAPPPAPGPEPEPPTEADDMQLYATNTAGTGFVIAADLSHKQGIPDAEDAQALLATGQYHEVHLTDAFIDAIPG